MNTFVNALNAANNAPVYDRSLTTTTNGAKTYSSSLNHNVDLFQRIGSARGVNLNDAFDKAFAENPDLAVRMLFWTRDIRGGAGERLTFRNLLKHMESQVKYHGVLENIISKIPEYGRWDDILGFQTEKFKTIAYTLIKKSLALCRFVWNLTTSKTPMHPSGFPYNDVWTDRTTTGNQFRYLIRHLELFDELFEFKNKRLYLKVGAEDLLDKYLDTTQPMLSHGYGTHWWIDARIKK